MGSEEDVIHLFVAAAGRYKKPVPDSSESIGTKGAFS